MTNENIYLGIIPTLTSPSKGTYIIDVNVDGLPPIKKINFSLRNPSSKEFEKFKRLRIEALKKMKKRRWYDGPIILDVTIYSCEQKSGKLLMDYLSGIMDTLGGSHGFTFTYLPIVYQDDCQVSSTHILFKRAGKNYYKIKIIFN